MVFILNGSEFQIKSMNCIRAGKISEAPEDEYQLVAKPMCLSESATWDKTEVGPNIFTYVDTSFLYKISLKSNILP